MAVKATKASMTKSAMRTPLTRHLRTFFACPLSRRSIAPTSCFTVQASLLFELPALNGRALDHLEEQAAGYDKLNLPAHLRIELEEKPPEVEALE
jgi:hypothetical protein